MDPLEVVLDESLDDTSNDAAIGQTLEQLRARLGGQTRKVNEVSTKLTAAQETALKLQQEKNAIAQQLADSASKSQGEITQLSAEKLALAAERELLTKQLADVTAAKAQLEQAAQVRTQILKDFGDQAPYLVQALNSGWLNTADKQGDDLKSHLQGYLDFHGRKATDAVEQAVRGASPPILTTGETTGTSIAALDQWLAEHDESDPNFSKMYDGWLTAVTAVPAK